MKYQRLDEVPSEDMAAAIQSVDDILAGLKGCAAAGTLPTVDFMAMTILADNRATPDEILAQHLSLMFSIAMHRLVAK